METLHAVVQVSLCCNTLVKEQAHKAAHTSAISPTWATAIACTFKVGVSG